MEMNEQLFIKGFNHGYILAEHESGILELIIRYNKSMNSYLSGLSFGQKEYKIHEADKEISKLREVKRETRNDREF